jgi:hypothetical protein
VVVKGGGYSLFFVSEPKIRKRKKGGGGYESNCVTTIIKIVL